MGPELTDTDEEKFAALREKLEGVTRAESPDSGQMSSFEPLDPMLAKPFEGELSALDESAWIAERKYDGTRIILEKFDGEVRLFTRRHIERSDTVPAIAEAAQEHLPDGLVLDGEVTFVDPAGRSYFTPIHGGEEMIEKHDLTPVYYVFDVLVEDTEWVIREPLHDRRDRLQRLVPDREPLAPVEAERRDFEAYFDDIVAGGEEGIIIKRVDSPYHLNTRSEHWRKVKAFTERDVLAVGYTPGEGKRSETFGALVMTDGENYIGRVGTGFSEQELELLLDTFTEVESKPVSPDQVGMPYTPIEPFVITVKYQEITDNGELRAPVYLHAKQGAPLTTVSPIASDQ